MVLCLVFILLMIVETYCLLGNSEIQHWCQSSAHFLSGGLCCLQFSGYLLKPSIRKYLHILKSMGIVSCTQSVLRYYNTTEMLCDRKGFAYAVQVCVGTSELRVT